MRVNRIPAALAVFALAVAAGCAAPQAATFTALGPMTDEQVVARLRARAAAIRTMYAVLEITYDSAKMNGTFEAACNYVAPGKMRMTAFKDLVVTTEPIFDMLLTPERYVMEMRDPKGGETRKSAGPRSEFAAKNPEFALFAIVGEGMFLPGIGAEHATGNAVAARLPSGAVASWIVDRDTLRVGEGRVGAIHITYDEYREDAGAVVPGEVRVLDGPTKMRVRVKELEANVPIDASIFEVR
jgi:hypothetical protein